MVRRWVCGVVVVAVILGSQSWSTPVMAKPSDYNLAEFVPAELGAIVLGGVGAGVGWYASFLFHDKSSDNITSDEQ